MAVQVSESDQVKQVKYLFLSQISMLIIYRFKVTKVLLSRQLKRYERLHRVL